MLSLYTPTAWLSSVHSFFILGTGMAMLRTTGQVFCSNLANNTTLLGIFQGTYGIGGISGPLIATSMLSHNLPWSRFYIILLCLAALNLIFSSWAFWDVEHDMDSPPAASTPQETEPSRAGYKQKLQSVKALLWNKPTILGSAFVFAYQGAEVAISGWIISFLVQFRHGDPSKVGYVTSGFWAGITLGMPLSSSPRPLPPNVLYITNIHQDASSSRS
jgi:fucose permease